MTKNKHPLRINIGFLLNQSVGTSHDFGFDFDRVKLPPDIEVSNFSGTAHITRTRQGLLVEGDFLGDVEQECVRCLTDVQQPLRTEFQELYAFKNNPISESGLTVPDDGYIDLGPIVGDYLIIEIPINPTCRDECRGLCPICGMNLNEEPESHSHPELMEE